MVYEVMVINLANYPDLRQEDTILCFKDLNVAESYFNDLKRKYDCAIYEFSIVSGIYKLLKTNT